MISKRIQNAIDIFLDAINEGTLVKGDCAYCAVGNLCKGVPHKEIEGITLVANARWRFLFETTNSIFSEDGFIQVRRNPSFFSEDGFIQVRRDPSFKNLFEEAERVISYTDFTEDELVQIEYAFETNTKIWYHQYPTGKYSKEEIRADQIKGLEAVIKVMMEFEDAKDDVKEVFTSKADLIPVYAYN